MNNKNSWIFLIVGLLIGGLTMHFCNNNSIHKNDNSSVGSGTISNVNPNLTKRTDCWNCGDNQSQKSGNQNITKLTSENVVANYIHQNKKLPEYYITKNEAKNHGWDPSQGNLCDVLPGKAIGGDHFSNREHQLPEGGRYFEADVNFECGRRQTDRLIYDEQGDVWVTHDHYKSFQKL